MPSTAAPSVTPEEFARLDDTERLELLDGVPVEKAMSTKTTRIGGRIHSLLDAFTVARQIGIAYPDGASYRCFPNPELIRKPDVSFFSKERWSEALEATPHIEAPPDLIVEVVSPTDRAGDLEAKIDEFFAAGTSEAWIVYPETRRLIRRYSDGTARSYGANEPLDAAPLVPGFSFKLSDLLVAVQP